MEINTIDTISKFNQERIEHWKRLTVILYEADDNTRCPVCKEQMIACDCVQKLAQDILESLFYRVIKLSPLECNPKKVKP